MAVETMNIYLWAKITRAAWGVSDDPEDWYVVSITHMESQPGRYIFVGLAGCDTEVVELWMKERRRFLAGECRNVHRMQYY